LKSLLGGYLVWLVRTVDSLQPEGGLKLNPVLELEPRPDSRTGTRIFEKYFVRGKKWSAG
jgi:hypothetical protein